MSTAGNHNNTAISSSTSNDAESANKRPREENGDSDHDSDGDQPKKVLRAAQRSSKSCPYLDTINRHMLDFDFEKVCSVSLSNLHVYACLVCGKYFQGRGIASHAYNHSIHESHHIYINLETRKVYCLPDNYEVIDPSLDDIKYMSNPTFTTEEVEQLDSRVTHFRGLDGHDYVPGVIGINNLKKTAYVSVVVNALVRVPPIRDFFLIAKNYAHVSFFPKYFGDTTTIKHNKVTQTHTAHTTHVSLNGGKMQWCIFHIFEAKYSRTTIFLATCRGMKIFAQIRLSQCRKF
eukprot:c11996_g4_i2.p1 GENE.c11996_g4_i2~~c11996_g4_i2.p1  ORF type:complete len:306 (-),score=85.13 c11996_g4_i2:28-897(-)